MKSLKRNSATLIIMMGVLFVLGSCKKNQTVDPDSFDPTKYYVTGEGVTNHNTTYALIFQHPAKVLFIGDGGKISSITNFSYKDGILYMADESFSFTIVNNKISTSNHPNLISYHLQKIPDADAFAGKTFSGTVSRNGVNAGVSCQLKFNADKMFTVKIDGFLQTPTYGSDYTLQNNGIATANTGNEGRLHLMSMADGKLYYSQFNAVDNSYSYGVLTPK